MYVRYCLVEIARKSVTETAVVGTNVSYVGLLFCGALKVAASAMLIHHGRFALVNGNYMYTIYCIICVNYNKLCVYYCVLLLLRTDQYWRADVCRWLSADSRGWDYFSGDGLKPRPAMQKIWYENLERQDGSDVTSREPIQCDIELDGETLRQVEQFKYLGSIFVREGGWDAKRMSKQGA